MSFRHQWDIKIISKFGEKATCTKCGLIKECFGWIGGFHYYHKEDDFYFHKTPRCGEKITKQMLKDANILYFKKHF